MEELMTAIDTIADDDEDLRAALTGGLWREGAPQRVVMSAMPYGRYFVVIDVPRPWAGEDHEDILLQFDMFSKDPHSRVIWSFDTKLKAAFPSELVYTGTLYTYIFWRQSSNVLKERGEVYHCIVEYSVQCIPN